MILQAMVRGRVQGVGFRMFVQDVAEELGLKGYVRNTEDGSVYVMAVGDEMGLRELLGRLRRGPAMAWITSVDERWSEGELDGLRPYFEVRP